MVTCITNSLDPYIHRYCATVESVDTYRAGLQIPLSLFQRTRLNGQRGHPASLREAISMPQEPAIFVGIVEPTFESKVRRVLVS